MEKQFTIGEPLVNFNRTYEEENYICSVFLNDDFRLIRFSSSYGSTPNEAKSNALAIVNAERMKEALEKMCKHHEKNASWDKGDNGYYEAKKLLNKTS